MPDLADVLVGRARFRLFLFVFGRPGCLLLLACLAAVGCGPSGVIPEANDPTRGNLAKLGQAYIRATINLNHPPENYEQLRPFLQEQGDPDQILVSPHDGEQFIIVWGVELRRLKAQGDAVPVIAYEQHGKDGRRYVLRGSRDPVILTDSQFRSAVFPEGYTPPS